MAGVSTPMQLPPETLAMLQQHGWKMTPATWAHRVSEGEWIPARHLKFIAAKIATAVMRGRARLILTMPFRHGKSELLSVNTPGWFLDLFPQRFVMLLSYGKDLATDHSRKAKDILMEREDILSVRIRRDVRSSERFRTTAGGGMFAAGLGGVITGRGAHLMLVDDYIKNTEQAFSAAKLAKDFEWFKSTARTRLEPGGSIIILATRWVQNDLIGRLKEEQPGIWEEISLPLEALADDPLGRTPGEPLWPERYDAEEVQSIKDDLGNFWFQSQAQQRPLPSMADSQRSEGLKYLDILPHSSRLRVVRAWDFAATPEGGDWTVGFLYAQNLMDGSFILLDLQRHQKGPKANEVIAQECARKDSQQFPQTSIKIEQEPGSSGKAFIEHYSEHVLEGYSVQGDHPTGPLEARASSFLAAIEAGNVYVYTGIAEEKIQAFKDELDAFPLGDHDDQIAAGSLAHKYVARKKKAAVWGRDSNSAAAARVSKVSPIRGATW